MKSLICFDSVRAATTYVQSLWQTDVFRRSAYVAQWVERFAQAPTAFAEMSKPDLETPHFGTYFGLTYRREYPSAAISDLYYLHEIVHAVESRYDPNILFTAWFRRMVMSEFRASLETEGFVYLHEPQLRDISFTDEIWADRFLGGQRKLGDGIFDIIRQERHRAMREPDPMDWCELQIAAYAKQNFEWASIWKFTATASGVTRPAYLHVEEHMAAVRQGKCAPAEHVRWLEQWGEVPFPDQARLFAPIYWHNKLSYRFQHMDRTT